MEDKIKVLLKEDEWEISDFSKEELDAIKNELELIDGNAITFDSKIEQILQKKVVNKLSYG